MTATMTAARRLRRRLPIAAAAALSAVAAGAVGVAEASTVEALDNREIVRRSARVVHGICTSAVSQRSADGRRIETVVRVRPFEVIKGQPAETIEFRQPGGTCDGETSVIHGLPTFTAGAEVVLCLSAEARVSRLCVPIGLAQGVFRVESTEQGRVAVRDTTGLERVGQGQLVAGVAAEHAPVERIPLDRLLAEIRSYVD